MTTTSATLHQTESRRPGWKVLALLVLAGAAAAIFLVAFALPYFELDPEKLALYPGREAWVIFHVSTGALALGLGPFVLWHGLKRRRMLLHRRIGMTYMAAIAFSSISAYYLAFHTQLGWVFGMGLTGLATAWLAATGLAYICIRKRMIEQHKEWMIRSYVVTFAFVNFRILVGILQATGVGTLNEQLTAASWFCWSVPLVITELILQGRKIWQPALSANAKLR
jgi:hypothetical protein